MCDNRINVNGLRLEMAILKGIVHITQYERLISELKLTQINLRNEPLPPTKIVVYFTVEVQIGK